MQLPTADDGAKHAYDTSGNRNEHFFRDCQFGSPSFNVSEVCFYLMPDLLVVSLSS
jgi:hypothetical protein